MVEQWLEANKGRVNIIETPQCFPDNLGWGIWLLDVDEPVVRGRTLAEAIEEVNRRG